MSYIPGDTIHGLFEINTVSGLTDADALPTGQVYLDGVANGAVVTVTNLATGRYKWSFTAPGAIGGSVVVVLLATVATFSYAESFGPWVLDSKRVGTLNDASTSAIADAVWDEMIGGHAAAGTTGEALAGVLNLTDSFIASSVWDVPMAAHVGAGTTGITLSGATAPSAAVVADAVWDELLAGHAIAGSSGAALSAAGSAGDPWSTVLPGSYPANTAGYIIGYYLDQRVSTCCPDSDCAQSSCDCSGPLGTYAL